MEDRRGTQFIGQRLPFICQHIGNHHLRAFAHEGANGFGAHAARTAGDNRNLVVKSGHEISLLRFRA